MYDIMIPAHEKDFSKLPFVYDSLIYLSGFNEIFMITNVKMPEKYRIGGVRYYTDNDVIDFDFNLFTGNIKKRTGWYRQQFVKLFQTATSDEYLITESDSIFNRPVDIYDPEGKPYFILGQDQNHKPYYEITKKLFGFGREYPYSFINEIQLTRREVVKSLVESTGLNKDGFFALIAAELNRTQEISGMSDYDLYGNWAWKNHPGMYSIKYGKSHVTAKHRGWNAVEIADHLNKFKGKEIDLIKIHSWI